MSAARLLASLLLLGAAAQACGGRSNLDGADVYAVDEGNVGTPNGNGNGNGNGSGAVAGSGAGTSNGSGAGTSNGSGASNGSRAGTSNGSGAGTSNGSGAGDGPGMGGVEPNPANPNCTPGNAKGGMACTAPCATTCGFYGMGTRSCDCVSDVFVSCHCPKPWNYQGRSTAPPCDTPDGRTHWIDNTACAEEWTQCIGTDPVSGTNPRGCVCLTDPVNGRLEWTCGSTNKWFLPE